MLTRISQLNKMGGWSLCPDLLGNTTDEWKRTSLEIVASPWTSASITFPASVRRIHYSLLFLQAQIHRGPCRKWLLFPTWTFSSESFWTLVMTWLSTPCSDILFYSHTKIPKTQIMTLSFCCSCMRLSRKKMCADLSLFQTFKKNLMKCLLVNVQLIHYQD